MTDSATDRSRRLSRRRVLRYAGIGGATALAGCQSRGNPDARNESQPSRQTSTNTTQTDVPDDLLEGRTIKMGVLAPLPTEHIIGQSMYYSAKLAADQLNADNGILGADVEVIPADTELQPTRARQQYVRLTTRENVDVTLGTLLGQVLATIMPLMARQQIPQITTGAAALRPAKLVSKNYEKYKYHFRAGPLNALQLAQAQLEFLDLYVDELGWESAALLVENRDDFDPYFRKLRAEAEEYLDLPIAKQTAVSLTNWSPVFDELEREGVDVALVAQSTSGIPAVKQWANQKRDFEYGGIHVWSQFTNYFETTNGSCEYVFTMNSLTPQTSNTPRTQPFLNEFYRRHGFYPIYAGPITYDAVRGFADGVEATGTLDQDVLIDFFEQWTWKKSTIIPKFEFTGRDAKYPHEPAWESMVETGVPVWQQWQTNEQGEGVMEAFAPKQNRTADYEKPPWIG